uniref:Peptidase M14 domain-containing protein n=1 Tax=Amphimedon queenslandica TaxID=400682 RepID=A0A1X7V284_AMPQE
MNSTSAMKVLLLAFLFGISQAAKYQRTVKYNDEILIRCPTGVEGIKNFLQSDDVDIWRVTPDGMADIRIDKHLLQENYTEAQTKCSMVANVEALVQEFEKMTTRTKKKGLKDTWFEEYGGSSDNPCSETYHGEGPASEPETQNTQNYFKDNAPIIGAIDWHSYGQLLLRPYGWTNEDAPDEEQMKRINDEMSDIIYNVLEKRYISQKSIGLYPTTGSADDWFYGEEATEANKGYRAPGITVELRDTGEYGFLLPPDQIIPTGEEVVPAVLHFAEQYYENPLYPQK